MKIKWGEKELEYLRKSVKEDEPVTDGKVWWVIFGLLIVMEIVLVAKIIGLF